MVSVWFLDRVDYFEVENQKERSAMAATAKRFDFLFFWRL